MIIKRKQTGSHTALKCIGMTLVEVLVAMVILGTLLTTALLARSRYLRQGVTAAEKQRGIAAADAMLVEWSIDPDAMTGEASGPVTGEPHLAWRTHFLDRDDARALGAKVLRLEIWENRMENLQPAATEPLASVELLIPLEPNVMTAQPAAKPAGIQ